jgi:hypothetical protein
MMIEITGTAAIRRNFMASHICMVKVPRPCFFGPLLCAARATVILCLFLCLDMGRVAFIDGRWLSSLSAKTLNLEADKRQQSNDYSR